MHIPPGLTDISEGLLTTQEKEAVRTARALTAVKVPTYLFIPKSARTTAKRNGFHMSGRRCGLSLDLYVKKPSVGHCGVCICVYMYNNICNRGVCIRTRKCLVGCGGGLAVLVIIKSGVIPCVTIYDASVRPSLKDGWPASASFRALCTRWGC